MKKVHFWGCLLLIIVMAACDKHEKEDMKPSVPSGQFVFNEKTYDLHYGYIRQNEWGMDWYNVILYSYDKTFLLDLQLYSKQGTILNGKYSQKGITVITDNSQIKARLSLFYEPEGMESYWGPYYNVEFGKNASGGYDLRISPVETPDEYIVNWSGEL